MLFCPSCRTAKARSAELVVRGCLRLSAPRLTLLALQEKLTTPRQLGGAGEFASTSPATSDAAWLEELVALLRSSRGGGDAEEAEVSKREHSAAAKVFRDNLGDTSQAATLLLTLSVLQQVLQGTSGASGAAFHDSLANKDIPRLLTELSLSNAPGLLRQRAGEVLEQWALSVLWDDSR